MNLENLISEVTTIFRTKLQDFCKKEDLSMLTPELAAKMIKQTKGLISLIGKRTLEDFFESFDSEVSTIQEEGELYRLKYKSSRKFITSIGDIQVSRNVYQRDKGGKAIVPLDRYWDMEHQYMTNEVQESILFSCAHNTPEETAQIFKKTSLFNLHPTTIKNLINNTGDFIEGHKDQIIEKIHKKEILEDTPDVMVCSLDGVNVLLNEKGKKKGRPKERPDKEDNNQTKSAYKNAVCGTVSFYNIEKAEETNKNKAIRTMTKYVSRMPQERYPKFKHEFENEIKHCTTTNPQKKILLTDGHKSIQGYIRENPLFADFVWMFDFFHAAEHLSKLSELIFGKSNKKGQKWYTKKRHELKYSENGVVNVIRSAEYYIKNKLTNKNKIMESNKELNYFKKHKKRMNYKLHIDNGWPIGSGVVEAACKSVVKQRMCRSGQRWTRNGGQKILDLRTFVKSKRWDEFWGIYTEIKYKKCA